MKKCGAKNINFDKMAAMRTQRQIFLNMSFVYAYNQIVSSCADQLLPQPLVNESKTVPTQWRHIEHIHEGV